MRQTCKCFDRQIIYYAHAMQKTFFLFVFMHATFTTIFIILFFFYRRVPTVASRKFLEPRHMTHVCDKWSRNKTAMIQHAFFNGMAN